MKNIILLLLVSINCCATQVSLQSFGAKGDGITDDIVFINKAIQTLKDRDTLVFEVGKNYLISSKMVIGVSCILIGNNATITPTDSFMRNGGICLSIARGLSSTSVPNLYAVKGATTISLPANIVVKAGDLIQFLSQDVLYYFRPGLATFNYLKGQYAIVTSVANNVATISTPFFDSFRVNTVALFKSCDSTVVSGLNFNLTQQPNTQNPLIGLSVKGTNIMVRNCSFTGNEYGFCAMQIDGENAVVKYCTIKDFFNGQGFAGGRLGYGINASCNNIVVENNTIANCKHGFTTAARKFVAIGITVSKNTFTEDTLQTITQLGSVNAQEDYAGTIDIHGGVAGNVLINENIIRSQGRAFFIRNGRASILNNTVYQNGNPTGLIGLEERPVENLLIQGNKFHLAYNGSPYVLGRYLSLAANPLYMKNTVVRNNTCVNGWLFFNNACKFTVDGLLIENNTLVTCQPLKLIKADPTVIFNNVSVVNSPVN